MMRCPGQSNRLLTASYHRCPRCGASVEMFSDEARRRCPDCGSEVHRDRPPSCIEWCPAARECVGAERYEALVEQRHGRGASGHHAQNNRKGGKPNEPEKDH